MKGEADAVIIVRRFLSDPYFPFQAAQEPGAGIDFVPTQCGRAIEIQIAKGARK